MRLEEFNYHLPENLIAQKPLPDRAASRLLVVDRAEGRIEHRGFRDLPGILAAGDLLVVNDTRVRPMRIAGRKKTGGAMELTLVGRVGDEFECLLKGGKPREELEIDLPGGARARVLGVSRAEVRVSPEKGAPLWRVKIEADNVEALLHRHGLTPLPPYIRREGASEDTIDRERYQTVYADKGEAAAAPTAGLHFSDDVLAEIEKRGIHMARLRLDVSYGTFAPVREENVEDHVMHPESYELTERAADEVNKTRAAGKNVVAVGTTAVRTLEHCAVSGEVKAGRGETSLFIIPGFTFRVIGALVTNFHMPRSTLIMLVAAFAGRELIMEAYRKAVERKYRFLSYGDAMLIL